MWQDGGMKERKASRAEQAARTCKDVARMKQMGGETQAKKKATRKDFSQAAAQIVREATDKV